MDRRFLLRSLFAVGGAITVLAIPKSSEAASFFDELENKDSKKLVSDADLPAMGRKMPSLVSVASRASTGSVVAFGFAGLSPAHG